MGVVQSAGRGGVFARGALAAGEVTWLPGCHAERDPVHLPSEGLALGHALSGDPAVAPAALARGPEGASLGEQRGGCLQVGVPSRPAAA